MVQYEFPRCDRQEPVSHHTCRCAAAATCRLTVAGAHDSRWRGKGRWRTVVICHRYLADTSVGDRAGCWKPAMHVSCRLRYEVFGIVHLGVGAHGTDVPAVRRGGGMVLPRRLLCMALVHNYSHAAVTATVICSGRKTVTWPVAGSMRELQLCSRQVCMHHMHSHNSGRSTAWHALHTLGSDASTRCTEQLAVVITTADGPSRPCMCRMGRYWLMP
jgi:hypothetical protein